MMRLTREADYALRVMLDVGVHADAHVSIADVARRQHIPYQFLRKVVQRLVADGLLVSRRGIHGGIFLAKAPETLTALDVVRCFGSVGLNRCTLDPCQCDHRDTCAMYPVWLEAQHEVERILSRTRLSTLIRRQVALERAAGRPRPDRGNILAGAGS